MDILEKIKQWIIKRGKMSFEMFTTREEFEDFFKLKLKRWGVEEVYFSDNPEEI